MFSVILPGRPCITNITTVEPPTKFAFTFPSAPHFSHIVVFILPGNALPPDTAAGVFIQFPGSQDFRFLGALANEKQSAIFKVHNVPSGMLGGGVAADRDAMIDEGATPAATAQGHITLGISIEPVASIQAQLATLQQERNVGSGSSAIVKAPLSTKVLAQRIAKNAINFLTSFSSDPAFLKAFQQWYDKFTRKVEVDPGFLERDE